MLSFSKSSFARRGPKISRSIAASVHHLLTLPILKYLINKCVRNTDLLHNILLVRPDIADRKFNATVMDSLEIPTRLRSRNRGLVDGSADLVVRGSQMRNKERN